MATNSKPVNIKELEIGKNGNLIKVNFTYFPVMIHPWRNKKRQAIMVTVLNKDNVIVDTGFSFYNPKDRGELPFSFPFGCRLALKRAIKSFPRDTQSEIRAVAHFAGVI